MKTSLPSHWALALFLSLVTFARGQIPPPNGPGNALSFDGVDDYLNATPPAVPTGNSPYTIEAWIRPTSLHVGAIAAWGNYGANDQVNAFVLTPTGLVNYWWANDLTATTANLAGAWHHVAATFDGTARRIHLDGVVVASDTPVGHNATPNNFRIGLANAGQYFNGQMDEVRIWNLSRSANEIREAMRRQLAGSESGLIAYYRFDENAGLSAFDSTGNANNTAALVNGPVWLASTVAPFAPPVASVTASNVTESSATLNGVVDGRTSLTAFEAYFEWGNTASLGSELHSGFTVSPGAAPQTFSTPLTGLVPGTTYHCRAVAVNTHGASFGATFVFTTSAVADYPSIVLADGPIAYYRFDDTPPVAVNRGRLGPAANGTYNNGAFSGAEAPRPPGFIGFEAANAALQLDGVDDFVGTVQGLLNSRPVFTISGWIRRIGSQPNRTGLWGQNDLVEFGYIDNNTIQAWTDSGLNVFPNPFPNGEWNYVALVSDGPTLTIYTNGLAAASRTQALPPANNFRFNIGGGGVFDGSGNFFNGQIDEVAVFDKALSADRIAEHYFTAKGSPPTITRQPQATNLFEGGTILLSVGAAGTPPLHYQWFSFGSEIMDQTNATLIISNATPPDSGTYSVQVSNDFGSKESELVEVNVVPTEPPTITQDPQSTVRSVGGSVTFTGTATGSTHMDYQWQQSGVNIPDATDPTLTLSNLQAADAGGYRLIACNVVGCATSVVATLTVVVPLIGRIGLNFGADEFAFNGGQPSWLAPTDVAGIVPQAKWNNLNGANGLASDVIADVESSSLPTSVSVAWSSPNTWSSTGRGEENNALPAGGDRILMTGYLDTSDQLAGAATVTVSGLGPEFTTSGYDVIVYCAGGVAGRGGAYTIGSTTKYGTTPANPDSHVEDPGIDLTDSGTYVRFSGLSGSSFTLTSEASTGPGKNLRAPINAIQIVRSRPPPPNCSGNALSFDGVNDYVDLPDAVWFTNDFTIEGWVFVRSYNNWSRLLECGNGEFSDNVQLSLTYGTTGTPHFNVLRTGDPVSQGIRSPSALPLNQWTHLACVLRGTTGTLYVNGAAVASGPMSVPRHVVRTQCYVGRSNWAADSYANAIFDEVRIWNIARSAAQIQANLHRQLFGDESGLVACYRLDEGGGPSAFDATGNANNTATLVNGPAWVASTVHLHILSGPSDAITHVGSRATFEVVVDGVPPYQFQWKRNDVPIPGATTRSYTIPSVAEADDGARFSVCITNACGFTNSPPALLTVLRNPVVTNCTSRGNCNAVYVQYNRPMNLDGVYTATCSNTVSSIVSPLVVTRIRYGRTPNEICLSVTPGLLPDTNVYCVAVRGAHAQDGLIIDPNPSTCCFIHGAEYPAWQVLFERYDDVGNGNLAAFLSSPKFINHQPDAVVLNPTGFFETPNNIRDNYGGRIFGFYIAPQDGNYFFWMSSDDQGATYLATDANPAHKFQICSEPAWGGVRSWADAGHDNNDNRGNPPVNGSIAQYPNGIPLTAGQKVYLEGLFTEGAVGDNYALTVTINDPTAPANGTSPISLDQFMTMRLSPDGTSFTTLCDVFFNPGPSDQTVYIGQSAEFSVTPDGTPPYTFQWKLNGVAIPGANGPTYTTAPATVANEGTYCLMVMNSFSTNQWCAVVHVLRNPIVVSASTRNNPNHIYILYNKPVVIGHPTLEYDFTDGPGIYVIGAVYGSSTSEVVVETDLIPPDTCLAFVIHDVVDTEANPLVPDPTGVVICRPNMVISGIRFNGLVIEVSFTTFPDLHYCLESKDALVPGPWTFVPGSARTGNGAVLTVPDTRPRLPMRFYRAVRTP